ncbi:putative FAD-binding domain, FAD/NAD(P)-binding domain superfamily [Helianthus annuus]|uniref:FAD-binding domain, FAD/NAD(P)-binding domain superfamily n=1 Tax=Helianthus annuus TaxID=4232 RepID=A0A251UWC0_HELAN|nr:monooxygenase 1 [Helianthus annuus]KAF5808881.1 putative FAD-binding domain, FAD/NAD(P)-binding domain superfamily [Helianthus annuus]KAJ0587299.1 putative FAD-binding domain, FAD/NAD(P)-binding domain superfamily [Helianthus annuus]KAJ0630445.1 putative FAD-binding domain, FAD/NAD(P)-binding domain superfamily [Helianthus annuus]KAJ0756532.1 putative FAD-binding domain, FAD/NAD(P)-binding domain superfamily [Helianthus annuus]KAJ0760285.1 putative FAD-binding domain, FAD/NAD(P)-binding dom
MYEEEVVIIGAGISGLATALALHKKGIKSIVMERSETLRNNSGTGIGIRPNGWRALDQLGVADILRRTAIPFQRERVVSLDGGRKQDISLYHCVGETRCLRRKDIIDTLYAALPPTTVKFSCQLDSIELDPLTTKPILRFIDGSSIITKVVIGCDGGKSIVSDFLNLKPTKMFPIFSVRGLTNYPHGHPFGHEFTNFMKDDMHVGRVPIDNNTIYWFSSQPYIPKDEGIWKNPEVIRQYAIELLGNFPHEIQEMAKNADINSLSFTHLRYRDPWDILVGTFSRGTVTVAGDAMHVMGPFMGQGGSAALEDAVVLARNMAQAGLNHIQSGSNVIVHRVGEAFNRFVRERRVRVVRLSLQAYLIGMMLGTSSHLKKIIWTILLNFFFPNQKSHMDYDCGDL